MRTASFVIGVGAALVFAGPVQGQRISYHSADADSDGRVSRDEYVVARDRQFGRFDRNGDGVISSTDFTRSASYFRALDKIDEALAVYDMNRDGSVTRTEVRESGTSLFDRADADRDGFLNQAELAQLHQTIAARRRSNR